MKQLTCEMCGGMDLLKQDGVFVCQTCGCKYSVEEAKKMMVEGTVEVQGTVKIDETSKIDKYFTLAKMADKQEERENYYNQIIEIDPTNYKAWLLKSHCCDRKDEQKCLDYAITYAPVEERQCIFEKAIEKIEFEFYTSQMDSFYDIEYDNEEEIVFCNISKWSNDGKDLIWINLCKNIYLRKELIKLLLINMPLIAGIKMPRSL